VLNDLFQLFLATTCQICESESLNQICRDCIVKASKPAFGRKFFSVYGNNPTFISQIIRWKDFGVTELTSDFALAFAETIRTVPEQFDAVTAIPARQASLRKRGWNPLAELACALCENLEIPFRPDFLFSNKEVSEQRGLSDEDRIKNLSDAFRSPEFSGRVLVIDDVVTSGCTLAAAKSALENAGAEVVVGCLAISRRSGPTFLV
jgi:predicted amidophosphoribosyltransferase